MPRELLSPVAFALLLALSLIGTACVERSREMTRSQREELEQFIGEEATSPQHSLDISFEDKIELIGYDVSSETWSPGQSLTVTWHWKVNRGLEDGWKLFTHVADAGHGNVLNEDGNGVVRAHYQPGRWKAGEYIRDQQQITLPQDWSSPRAVFYLGLWNGPNRLSVTRGPADEENRARPLTITTPHGAAPSESDPAADDLPTLQAPRAESISIDGRLDEATWQQAPSTRPFVNTLSGEAAGFRVTAKAAYDDGHLYVGFVVDDDHLKSPFTERDDHLWEADCVEIMVDPDGDGRNYFEMQVSPRGVVFDTRYDARRVPGPIGHADWNSALRTAVDARGTIGDDDEDEGYTAEIAIPWSAFAHGTPPASPPSAGDTWRINFYVMDAREEGQRAAGWSAPKVGDFHVPARFGRIHFAGDPAAQGASMASPALQNTPAAEAIRQQVRQRLQQTQMRVGQIDNANRPQPGEPLPTPDNPRPAAMAASMR